MTSQRYNVVAELVWSAPGWKTVAGKCTPTDLKAEDRLPVKISLAGITNFYGSETSILTTADSLMPLVRTKNHASPAAR